MSKQKCIHTFLLGQYAFLADVLFSNRHAEIEKERGFSGKVVDGTLQRDI